MSINFVKNASAGKKDGGLYAAYIRRNSDGSSLSGETWHEVAYREKHDFDLIEPSEPQKLEDGSIQDYDQGDLKFVVKFTLSQNDAITNNFLIQETGANKYYSFVCDCGFGANGTREYFYIPRCNFEKGVKYTSPGRRPELTILGMSPTTTWNANSLTAGSSLFTTWNYSPISLSASLSGTIDFPVTWAEI